MHWDRVTHFRLLIIGAFDLTSKRCVFQNGWIDGRDAFHAVPCLECCAMD